MKYVANPVEVEAFEILECGELMMLLDKPHSMLLKLSEGQSAVVDAGMLARFIPGRGDYWVMQEDGYIYVNPKEVFERKYRSAGG